MKTKTLLHFVFILSLPLHSSASTQTQKPYSVLTWSEVYKPLMQQIEAKGEARYFGRVEGVDYDIDFAGAAALAKHDKQYLEEFLNQKAEEGLELVTVIGSDINTRFIFKRK